MKREPRPKYASEMTTDELERLTADLDQEFIADTFHPLTPAERKHWEKLRRKPGRPRTGAGAKVISLSVERTLLAKSDRLAKKLHLTRAALVDRALREMLAANHTRPRKTGS